MQTLHIEQEINISLESQLETLALEANSLSNLIETFSSVLPKVTVKLRDMSVLLESVLNPAEETQIVTLSKELKEKAPHLNYAKLSHMLVSAPEGFKGSMSDYLDIMLEMHSNVYQTANNLLSEYSLIIAKFISNKDAKYSNAEHKALFTKAAKEREQITDNINKFFNPNSNVSRVRVSSYLDRINDLDELLKKTQMLEKIVDGQNLSDIAKSVARVVELLNIIQRNMDDGDLVNVSGSASLSISNGAYELAKTIEVVSIYRFKSQQLIAAIANTFKTLNSM